jgi:hypothetical protein
VQRKINGWIQAADVWKGLRDDLPGLWEKLAQIPEDADETPVQKWTAAYASRSRPPPFFAFDPLTGVLSHGGKTIKAFVRGTPQEHESFRGDLVFDGKQATFLLPPASVSVKGSASGDGKRDAPGMFAARATNGYEPVTVVAVEVGTPPNTHKVPAVPNLHKVVNDLCYQVGEAVGFAGDKDVIERLGFALHVWHTPVNLNIARALFYHGVGDRAGGIMVGFHGRVDLDIQAARGIALERWPAALRGGRGLHLERGDVQPGHEPHHL